MIHLYICDDTLCVLHGIGDLVLSESQSEEAEVLSVSHFIVCCSYLQLNLLKKL